jgi:hypothetical protein
VVAAMAAMAVIVWLSSFPCGDAFMLALRWIEC